MSNLLDVLLADGQRISERRTAPPPNKPATRADQIIAEGDRRRCEYRRINPTADTAMVYGAQVGYLNAQVRILCTEAEALTIKRDKALGYAALHCDALGGEVWCGYSYTEGEDAKVYGPPENCHPGSPDELELSEVWVNGREVVGALSDEVREDLQDRMLARARLMLASAREADAAEAEDPKVRP